MLRTDAVASYRGFAYDWGAVIVTDVLVRSGVLAGLPRMIRRHNSG
jgi:hypothetical protein